MSKYNRYAKELDRAFRGAREAYRKVASRLEAAKQEKTAAWGWFEENYVGERGLRRQRADMELKLTQSEFDEATKRIWIEFNDRRDELTRELAAEVKKDALATPEAIDHDGLKLLESGMLSADELANLADRYAENSTMLKFVAKAAKEMADGAEGVERTKLVALHMSAKDGLPPVMQEWENLVTLSRYCSGLNGPRPNIDPEYTAKMAGCWEEMSAAAVESF